MFNCRNVCLSDNSVTALSLFTFQTSSSRSVEDAVPYIFRFGCRLLSDSLFIISRINALVNTFFQKIQNFLSCLESLCAAALCASDLPIISPLISFVKSFFQKILLFFEHSIYCVFCALITQDEILAEKKRAEALFQINS